MCANAATHFVRMSRLASPVTSSSNAEKCSKYGMTSPYRFRANSTSASSQCSAETAGPKAMAIEIDWDSMPSFASSLLILFHEISR